VADLDAAIEVAGVPRSRGKAYRDGTHRARHPEETFAQARALMAELGITRLADITGLDTIGYPVWLAVRPNSRAGSTSQGKGHDAITAKVSALMEAIESWHAERVAAPLCIEPYPALSRGDDVAPVELLPRREGVALRPEQPMIFARGWDVARGRASWVPWEMVTANFVELSSQGPTFLRSTNGLASGNDLLEAIVHASCEVIERDALTLHRLARPAAGSEDARRLDLSTVDDPICAAALQLLAERGVELAAWDITSDVGIPAYECRLYETGRARWREVGMFSGYGCHLDPAVALVRAVSEAIQSRLTFISGSREDLFAADYERQRRSQGDVAAAHARFTAPGPRVDFRARRSLATDSFQGDLRVILSRLAAVGVDRLIAVDLTRPEVGIPVVKVVIPGLEAKGEFPDHTLTAHAAARLGGPS
jgi:YcaO-like protein with predicted kinase domain